jgi:altronate dehydratase small subunit
MAETSRAIVVDERDSVATALADLAAGEVLALRVGGADYRIALRAPVVFGHKVALVALEAGEPVIKYGEVIGRATEAIAPGDHVHLHNLEGMRGRGDLR